MEPKTGWDNVDRIRKERLAKARQARAIGTATKRQLKLIAAFDARQKGDATETQLSFLARSGF